MVAVTVALLAPATSADQAQASLQAKRPLLKEAGVAGGIEGLFRAHWSLVCSLLDEIRRSSRCSE